MNAPTPPSSLKRSLKRRFPDIGYAAKTIAALWLIYLATVIVRAVAAGGEYPYGVEDFISRVVTGSLLCAFIYVLMAFAKRMRAKMFAAAVGSVVAGVTMATILVMDLPKSDDYSATLAPGVTLERKGLDVWIEKDDGTSFSFRMAPVQFGDADTPVRIAGTSFTWLFFFGAWSAMYLAGLSSGQVQEARRRAAEAELIAQDATVRALRYQINPHFLFNTLNSLSSLVMRGDNDRAEDMLMALSTFFRTSLSIEPGATVSLDEEIGLQRLYLDIEEARFPKRLKIEIDVPDDIRRVTVPALILQPLIENAIKYGVSASRKAVTLSIRGHRLDDGRVQIDVTNSAPDSKPGNDPAARPAGTGTGLVNVCQRLETHYGKAADCRFGPVAGGYRVSLALPATEIIDD